MSFLGDAFQRDDVAGRLLGQYNGGSGVPVSRAANDETARQQSILKATGQINSAFDNPARQQQYSDYGNALKAYYNDSLNRQRDQTSRGLKFALSRSGLTGGSTAADEGNLSSQDYIRGLLGVSNNVQGSVANLKSQDEATRANLLQMAQGGNSIGNINPFLQSIQQVGQARSGIAPAALGDAFGDIGSFINKKQSAAETQQAASGIWG